MAWDGGASSLSKSSRSIRAASREYTLKLTPPCSTEAPNGALRPVVGKVCSAESRSEIAVVGLLFDPTCIIHLLCLSFHRVLKRCVQSHAGISSRRGRDGQRPSRRRAES